LLGELEGDDKVVVCDLEAGVGTLLRLQAEQADLVLVVAEPTAKSIEIARRAAEVAAARVDVLVVANRVRSDADVEAVRAVLGEHEVVVVPEDPVIERADREGCAPIDADGASPGVGALVGLAERIASR
jgi:CO dehydrogenase maturation factor